MFTMPAASKNSVALVILLPKGASPSFFVVVIEKFISPSPEGIFKSDAQCIELRCCNPPQNFKKVKFH